MPKTLLGLSKNQAFAYMGGLLDGEGTLGARMQGNAVITRVHLYNTDTQILADIHRLVGGNLSINERSNEDHQPIGIWALYGENSESFIRRLLPFLFIKQREAQVWLAIRARIGNEITPQEIQERERLIKELKLLKRADYRRGNATIKLNKNQRESTTKVKITTEDGEEFWV